MNYSNISKFLAFIPTIMRAIMQNTNHGLLYYIVVKARKLGPDTQLESGEDTLFCSVPFWCYHVLKQKIPRRSQHVGQRISLGSFTTKSGSRGIHIILFGVGEGGKTSGELFAKSHQLLQFLSCFLNFSYITHSLMLGRDWENFFFLWGWGGGRSLLPLAPPLNNGCQIWVIEYSVITQPLTYPLARQ